MKVGLNGLIIDKKKAGIGNYAYNLIQNILKVGNHDYTVFFQEHLKEDFKGVSRKNYNGTYQRILDEQFCLLKEFRKFDLLHFMDYSSPLIDIKVPYIVTIHDLSFYRFPKCFTFGRRMIKKIIGPVSIKRAVKIIADSENTRKDIVDLFSADEQKVVVVYPGRSGFVRVTDTQKIQSVKEKYGIKGDYILFVGTLEPRKNIERLLLAYRILLNKNVKENLVIVGRTGWLYERIFKTARDLGIEDRVCFTGFVEDEDMPAIYSGAKVFVYPSLYEGFGLPPLEAMECRVPVVVSDRSSLPEVVGSSGMYVDPYDENSIAEGIHKLLIDEELRNNLSVAGLERAKNFDWEKAAKRVVAIYDEVLG
ncbi:MAG: hypothetical protein PWQ82_1331 [Thermosediminibacterales bacterium]|nr:hypothetical protein [Thermosediminibacterales bacterium]MDK2835597.1 hypothetical protein [Thermosediminibacterales bacterium]